MANQKEKFIYISGRKMYFYIALITAQGYFKILKKYVKFFCCPLNVAIILKNDHEDFWFTAEEKQYARVASYYLDHGKEILKFIKQFNIDFSKVRHETLRHLPRINELSDREIAEDIKKIFLQIRTDISGVIIARRLDQFLLPQLRRGMMESLNKPAGEIDALIAKTVKSPYLSYQAKEKNIFFSKLSRLDKNNQTEIRKFIDNYLKEFAWVNISYYDEPPLSRDDLLKRLKEKPQIIKAEGLRISNKISHKYRSMIKVLSYSAYLKDFLRGKNAELIWLLEPYFKELSKRFNLPIKAIKSYSPEEIFKLIHTAKKVSAKKLWQRQNLTVFFKDKRLEGGQAKKIIKQYNLISHLDKSQTVFSGRTACQGSAMGKALVVYRVEEIKKFKEKKFILVVQNTNPAFVPYLKKTIGIVAEEGGITTHVSLIAREFKIPAVVGVPNITKIIKTGDFVEVDANKGVVKVLKRKSSKG